VNMTREHYPDPGRYCRLWRRVASAAATDPEQRVDPVWAYHALGSNACTMRELRGQFTCALHNRINSRGGLDGFRGRKDNSDYLAQCYRDQSAIRRRILKHVIVRQFETRECRRRFSHLLYDGE
jgi:hypothetical protein